MPRPQSRNGWSPTGMTRHRFSWLRQKMILQMQEEREVAWLPMHGKPHTETQRRWRDASPEDVYAIGFAIEHNNPSERGA